ncbi:MAG TPA: hypothetical protein VLG38_04675 [Gammaproteobacteria bacterium]|nr:hypothetical protein [Gammaproteobacteria bacterium]
MTIEKFLTACKNNNAEVIRELVAAGFTQFTHNDNVGLKLAAKYDSYLVAIELMRIPAVRDLEAATFAALSIAVNRKSANAIYYIGKELNAAQIEIPQNLKERTSDVFKQSEFIHQTSHMIFSTRGNERDSSDSTLSGVTPLPTSSSLTAHTFVGTLLSNEPTPITTTTTPRRRFGFLFGGCTT